MECSENLALMNREKWLSNMKLNAYKKLKMNTQRKLDKNMFHD